MERYIEVSTLSNFEVTCSDGKKYVLLPFEHLYDIPTADVIPRAEYENAIIDRNAARLGMIAEHERLKMARAEVVREIFEEIEGALECAYDSDQQSDYPMPYYHEYLKDDIAELKKKYTEKK